MCWAVRSTASKPWSSAPTSWSRSAETPSASRSSPRRAVAQRAPGAAQRERRCLPLTYANLPLPRILFRITAIPLADRAVPVVDLSRRVGRLNRRERLEDLVRVPGVPGNDPRVARLQKDHLALAVQLGASRDHIAHRLVIPCDLRHRRTRRPVAPQPHPHADPRRQVHLAQRAVRRVRAVDLDDCLVAHGAIEPAAGCPHKKRTRDRRRPAPRRCARGD